ncbi:hypothetical protein tb265_48640 [Gemmatimonadetes bacterium T265]|nr:hypothetical protein tb265_48640 [Gemmatimonadetes bacterium T265]
MRGGWEARAGLGRGGDVEAVSGRGSDADGEAMTPESARMAAASPALERAAAILFARWKPTLVLLLAAGARRRGDLDRCLPSEVSTKVLTEQLRGLEADGIVERVDYRAIRHAGQRHVTYALTPAGQELSRVVQSLAQWGVEQTLYDRGTRARAVQEQEQEGNAPVPRNRVADADDPRLPTLIPFRPGA